MRLNVGVRHPPTGSKKFRKYGTNGGIGASYPYESRFLEATMADKTYSFDLGGMNPDAQRSAAEAAGKVLHMEEKAGQTVAQELLPALDLITEALHIAQQAGNVQGFGELNTGEKAMAHYREQAPDMVAHLTALQEDCQAKIDHVLAMEVLYNNMDAYNAGRVFDHKLSVEYK
ncbi:Uncharacterised protein [Mycobacteroides abscessus subsp. abscessus]|nr:hypothetical protein M879_09040 [Mycobacteroides abscessus V06705]MBE5399383.1 hypothetical protein [Mycobacteroides abscessus]SHO86312.1 Uncharacterised protein [Mycobacteroides abscessus subsp. abscessus]MBE5408467.1 hypothetical protein [Mycobacteroides abscessus]MBE5413501.1 hypothetical protein [Mycobacteroides abscessus]